MASKIACDPAAKTRDAISTNHWGVSLVHAPGSEFTAIKQRLDAFDLEILGTGHSGDILFASLVASADLAFLKRLLGAD